MTPEKPNFEVKRRNVMIVPVGLEKSRVVDGCISYPVNVVYLITNPAPKKYVEPPAVQRYANIFAEQVKEDLKERIRFIYQISTRLNSFQACIRILQEIYQKETSKETEGKLQLIYINISTASKAFAIAAYIFGLYHPEKVQIFYAGTDNYVLLDHLKDKNTSSLETDFLKNGLTNGPYSVEEIPLVPLTPLSERERNFLKELVSREEYGSIKKILQNSNLFEDNKVNRIYVHDILEKFEGHSLLKQIKEGREKRVIISQRARDLANLF